MVCAPEGDCGNRAGCVGVCLPRVCLRRVPSRRLVRMRWGPVQEANPHPVAGSGTVHRTPPRGVALLGYDRPYGGSHINLCNWKNVVLRASRAKNGRFGGAAGRGRRGAAGGVAGGPPTVGSRGGPWWGDHGPTAPVRSDGGRAWSPLLRGPLSSPQMVGRRVVPKTNNISLPRMNLSPTYMHAPHVTPHGAQGTIGRPQEGRNGRCVG